ncbi:MAG: tetratricopeptide repeat protein [Spirochaetes bacterium]|nr:tetratricopeptide repeat protein [Spirochaetota bacterium]
MSYVVIFIGAFIGFALLGGLFFLGKKFLVPRKMSDVKNMIKTANYKEAIKIAKEVLSKKPNDFEAHYYLGECYYQEGKHELALIEFKAADKIGQFGSGINEADIRDRLAELYIEFNNFDEALKEYALLQKISPEDYYVYYKMGNLFEKKQQRNQAIKYYAKSFQLKGNYPPALLSLGVLLYEAKKYGDAEKMLEKANRLEPDNFKAQFYLGMANKSSNNAKKAIKYFELAQKGKDFKVRSLGEIGMLYLVGGKYEEASIHLERALKNSEGESLNLILNIRFILASCYESMRNITEAIKQWEMIYSKKPDFKNVAEKLATYQDLRMDDNMKDYMTATNEEFIDICRKIIEYRGLKELNLDVMSTDDVQIVTVENSEGWRNVKKKPYLLRIFRKSEPVGEKILREIHEEMRKNEIFKAFVFTSSSFTNQAITFAQERPIELIDKSNLQNILREIR